jgi:hypothetical protein
MQNMTIYETQAMTARITEDRKVAVLTFKQHGLAPVSIQMPVEAFERFLQQATRELAGATQAGKA